MTEPKEVEQLDASTQRLTEMVSTLANALSIQGELQQKTIALRESQDRLDERTTKVQEHVTTTEGELVAIRGELIPRAEHDKRRRRNRRVVAITTLVVLGIASLGAWQLEQNNAQSQRLTDASYQRNMTDYANCLTRNEQIAAQVKLWNDERKDAIHYNLPELVTSFENAIAGEPAPVNCATFKTQADELRSRGAK